MARPERPALLLGLLALLLPLLGHAEVPTAARQAIRTGDFAAAEAVLRPLAEGGDADALYELGRMRQRGLGAAADPALAFDYYARAAALGHVESAYLLGVAYSAGRVVARDEAEARRWLTAAQAAGHERARLKLEALRQESAREQTPAWASLAGLAETLRRCDGEGLAVLCPEAGDASELQAMLRDALPQAVDCGEPALLETLLACGADLSATDPAGNTALHRAVAARQQAAARLLLSRGSPEHVLNDAGWSPRMLAERSGDQALRRLFEIDGPSVGTSLEMLQAASGTASHKGWSPLAIAAWRGELELVEDLLRGGADVNAVDASGRSALSRALSQGQGDAARALLRAGARADAGMLALAIEAGDPNLLEPLVRAGASITAGDHDDLPSPLYLAVQSKQPAAVAELLRLGVDPDRGFRENAPLMLAAREGHGEILGELLGAGASPALLDGSGCSALCWALRSRQPALALDLIAAGATDSTDRHGETSLMLAARAGCVECVDRLLAAGGGSVDAQSASGAHALMLAAAAGHHDVAEALLAADADVGLANHVGDTALILAVREDHKAVATLLLRHGANARARNARFESARSLAEQKDDDWSEVFEAESGLWRYVSGGP